MLLEDSFRRKEKEKRYRIGDFFTDTMSTMITNAVLGTDSI